MKRFAVSISAIVLIVVAAGSAVAQCSLDLTDIRDEPASVTSANPSRRVYRFKAVSRPGSYDTDIYINVAGGGLGGQQIACDPPFSDTECIAELFCVRPGAYEIWALATCDGFVERKMLPLEVPDVAPDVEITGVVRLPDGRYRVDTLFTLPIGQWPVLPTYSVEHRQPDGTYSPPVLSQTNVLTAAPGDKVGVVYRVCYNANPDVQGSSEAYAVIPAPPSVEVAVLDGDGQRAVPGERAERLLRVRFTASDPAFDLRTLSAVFEVVSVPSNATGQGVGATETGIAQSFSAPVASDGTAAATMVAGSVAGPYVVRVKSPMSLTGSEARFTTTALKPDDVGILKDTPDMADFASSYAVSATDPSTFYSVGLDATGQKIGPMKCNWSASASGNASTRGDGVLAPSSRIASTTFQPRKTGLMKLTASPVLSKVRAGSADLFITGLFVSVQNTFNPASPVDDSARFVPGMYLDGTSVALDVMETTGQFISLHIPTGGSKGKATFTVDSTNYPGIAMNYPLSGDATEDMQFTNGQQSITVDFAPSTGDTWTTLLVRDFGASGTIRVSIKSGKTTYALKPLKLPVDADGNGLPDAGWHLQGGGHINDPSLTAAGDVDTDPPGVSDPIETAFGDGLSNFEEYRGFIFAGSYQRFDPNTKDLVLVVDPLILTDAQTLNFFTSQVPFRKHYADLADVAGDAYPSRAIEKIRPVINCNRTGVPGARSAGTRGVRIIEQEQFVPAYVLAGAGFPVWQAGVLGVTWADGMPNLDILNSPANVAGAVIQSPDHTQFVEVYPQTLRNHGIATNFANPSAYRDVSGNTVPDCNVSNTGNCDFWDTAHGLIVPHQQPAGNYILNTVLDPGTMPDAHYSKYARTCADPNQVLPQGFSATQMSRLRTILVGHELGHAMQLEHRTNTLADCRSIMFDNMLPGADRRTWADMIPLATSYDNLVDFMRLWQ